MSWGLSVSLIITTIAPRDSPAVKWLITVDHVELNLTQTLKPLWMEPLFKRKSASSSGGWSQLQMPKIHVISNFQGELELIFSNRPTNLSVCLWRHNSFVCFAPNLTQFILPVSLPRCIAWFRISPSNLPATCPHSLTSWLPTAPSPIQSCWIGDDYLKYRKDDAFQMDTKTWIRLRWFLLVLTIWCIDNESVKPN